MWLRLDDCALGASVVERKEIFPLSSVQTGSGAHPNFFSVVIEDSFYKGRAAKT